MQHQRLPYGARSEDEMHAEPGRLGAQWQQRERSWDERLGDIGPPLPLLPVLWTVGIVAVVVGGIVLIAHMGWSLPRFF